MDYRIFNVRTAVNACDCIEGCTDTVRESALKIKSGRKISFRTGESNMPQRRAGPTLFKLSYIPTPTHMRYGQTHRLRSYHRRRETHTQRQRKREMLSPELLASFSVNLRENKQRIRSCV